MNDIFSIVKKLEQDYTEGNTIISEYVDFSMYDTINRIDAYYYSKHISGDKDSMNRDKPFFNICKASTNIWYRATDIDRKHIKIKAGKSGQVLASFIATAHLQDFMKREAFGQFLNEWGRTLAKYGSAVSKHVEKGGRLHSNVVPWNRLIVDPIDFNNNVVIEVLELTPAQLRKNKAYDKEQIESLIQAVEARQTLRGQKRDNKNDYIKLYEVHGELPLSFITGNEDDEETYVQQMHVISRVETKRGKFEDFSLIKGREEKSPYMISHLIKEDGRTLGVGAIEGIFEPQWMINHSMKAVKDQLDLASKLIFQTADSAFVGKNVLSNIENGEIFVHAPNAPVTQVNNNSHDVTSLVRFSQEWQSISREINSTPDSLMGNTAPSGTAWRQVEALQQEAHSLFEIMTENKGLALEEMLRVFILPFIKKKMDTIKEIEVTLDAHNIEKVEAMFVKGMTAKLNNERIKQALITGNTERLNAQAQQEDMMQDEQTLRQALSGSVRYIKPSDIDQKKWSDILDGFEWDVEVDITKEAKDVNAVLTTLNSVFTTLANPATAAVLQTPQGKFVFNQIMETVGTVSPIELKELEAQPMPAMAPTQIPQISQPIEES